MGTCCAKSPREQQATFDAINPQGRRRKNTKRNSKRRSSRNDSDVLVSGDGKRRKSKQSAVLEVPYADRNVLARRMNQETIQPYEEAPAPAHETLSSISSLHHSDAEQDRPTSANIPAAAAADGHAHTLDRSVLRGAAHGCRWNANTMQHWIDGVGGDNPAAESDEHDAFPLTPEQQRQPDGGGEFNKSESTQSEAPSSTKDSEWMYNLEELDKEYERRRQSAAT